MQYDFSKPSPYRQAYINGEIVEYDMCSSNLNMNKEQPNFEFIGEGEIYAINGVEQSFDDERFLFWRRIKNSQP